MVLEALDRAVRQENEIKELQIGDMILYIRDSKNSTGKLLERISDSGGRIQSTLLSFIRGWISFRRAEPSVPSPKVSLSKTIALWAKFQHMNFEGIHTHTQTKFYHRHRWNSYPSLWRIKLFHPRDPRSLICSAPLKDLKPRVTRFGWNTGPTCILEYCSLAANL